MPETRRATDEFVGIYRSTDTGRRDSVPHRAGLHDFHHYAGAGTHAGEQNLPVARRTVRARAVEHFDVVLDGAGGAFRVPGDYLYRTFQSFQFDGGMWGLFRVEPLRDNPGQQTLRGTRGQQLRP